jgi:hypothetical protein
LQHFTDGAMKEPNFEDEQTLQSARPVVPLEKIDAKERHRRHWLLGGAFALAMMLGAASALLASYLKLRNVPAAASEISEVETPAAPIAVAAQPVEGDLAETADTIETVNIEEPAATPVTPKRAPSRRTVTIPRNTDLVRPRTVRGDEEDELEQIRSAILIDEWQERRARRAARRERRNRVDHHDRDLSDLDEIFEGQRRRRP